MSCLIIHQHQPSTRSVARSATPLRRNAHDVGCSNARRWEQSVSRRRAPSSVPAKRAPTCIKNRIHPTRARAISRRREPSERPRIRGLRIFNCRRYRRSRRKGRVRLWEEGNSRWTLLRLPPVSGTADRGDQREYPDIRPRARSPHHDRERSIERNTLHYEHGARGCRRRRCGPSQATPRAPGTEGARGRPARTDVAKSGRSQSHRAGLESLRTTYS